MGNFSQFNKEVVAHNPQFKKEGNLISSLFVRLLLCSCKSKNDSKGIS